MEGRRKERFLGHVVQWHSNWRSPLHWEAWWSWAAGRTSPHSSSLSPTEKSMGLVHQALLDIKFWPAVILLSIVTASTALYNQQERKDGHRLWMTKFAIKTSKLRHDTVLFIKFIFWLRSQFTKYLWKTMDYLKCIISLVRMRFIFKWWQYTQRRENDIIKK